MPPRLVRGDTKTMNTGTSSMRLRVSLLGRFIEIPPIRYFTTVPYRS